MKLLHNELKSEYRNGSLDCLSDMTREGTEPVFFVHAQCFRKSNSRTFKDIHPQIQGLSRTMPIFKDFQGQENQKINFKDFQGPARALSLGS